MKTEEPKEVRFSVIFHDDGNVTRKAQRTGGVSTTQLLTAISVVRHACDVAAAELLSDVLEDSE